MNTVHSLLKFINQVKINVRHQLSHWPVLYAFIGSIGVILIWRGVWMMADDLQMAGWLSLFLGVLISMSVGLFVSFFVGDSIIITGIKQEKRIDEKTESEIKREEVTLVQIKKELKDIKKEIGEM